MAQSTRSFQYFLIYMYRMLNIYLSMVRWEKMANNIQCQQIVYVQEFSRLVSACAEFQFIWANSSFLMINSVEKGLLEQVFRRHDSNLWQNIPYGTTKKNDYVWPWWTFF